MFVSFRPIYLYITAPPYIHAKERLWTAPFDSASFQFSVAFAASSAQRIAGALAACIKEVLEILCRGS